MRAAIHFSGTHTNTAHRAGKHCDSAARAALAGAVGDTNARSMSHTQFTANPRDYNPDNKHGGGYWLFERQIGNSSPMTAKSTYAAETCAAAVNAATQIEPTKGLRCTLTGYEQARAQNLSGALEAAGAEKTTRVGDMIGYTTTYGAMVQKEPLTGGSAAAGAPRVESAAPEFRCAACGAALPRRLILVVGRDGDTALCCIAVCIRAGFMRS